MTAGAASEPMSFRAPAVRIVHWSGAISIAFGLAALLGWRFEIGVLRGLGPSFMPMPAPSALCFVVTGIALAFSVSRLRAARIGGALLAIPLIAAAALTGVEYLFGVDSGVRRALAGHARFGEAGALLPMSPESALAFALLAGSLLATRPVLAQGLAVIPLSLGAIALVGYAFGAPPSSLLRMKASMSLYSSLAFLAAGSGALFRKPEGGFAAALLDPTVAGRELRRLIAPALAIPLVAAAMVLAITRLRLMSPATEATLLAVTTMAALLAVAFRSYHSLRRAEHERMQALSALVVSEGRYRRTFDNAPVGMAHLSADGRWLSVNPRLEEMLGYASEDLLTMTYADVTPLDDLGFDAKQWEMLRRGEIASYGVERHFRTKEGELVLADVRLVREEDEAKRLLHFSAVIQDITARRLSEGMLRVYERALAATQNGIVITDARKTDNPIAYVNPAYLAITGYDAAELIGKNPRLLNAKARDQVALNDVRHAVQQGEECSVLVRNHRKNGEPFWNQLAIAPVRDSGGSLTHFIGLVMDVTESVATANERDDQLEAAEANNEAKDRFLSVLSHELRSPLNAILAWTSILREQGGAIAGRAVDAIDSAAKSQARLVDDLLDASRIRAGTLEIVPTRIELRPVARSAVDQLLPIAVARGVSLRLELPPNEIDAQLDPERITQILRNLVDNALKFTPKGGSVDVSVLDEGERFAIEVRDTGRGIAPSELPFVFDAFWRAEGKNRPHGLGLGLAIVRHFTERQGGRVTVESEGLERGAAFRLSFPKAGQADVAAQEPEKPSEPNKASLQGLEIVVTEDDVATLEATAAAMRKAGAIPRLAQSVAEALRLFESSLPNVLISDIDLPDRDGLDLIRSVRALGEPRSSLLAVAVTGLADPADRRRIQRAGYDACLSKPIAPGLVVEQVRVLLAQLDAPVIAQARRTLVVGGDQRSVDELAAALHTLQQQVAIAADASALLETALASPQDVIFVRMPLEGFDVEVLAERLRAKERRALLIGIVPEGEAREQGAFDFVLSEPVSIAALQRRLLLAPSAP